MKTTSIKIDVTQATPLPKGRVNYARLDATTPADIRQQQAADDAQAMQQTAKFARSTRQRLGLTQQEFSTRIEVPVETIRNWEQGKRSPTGAAKALLRVLSRVPEAALGALA